MKKIILFDLDSTLLQMNQDLFLKKYFTLIYSYSARLGYNPDEFMTLFNKAAYAIVKNDGSKTNEEVFWDLIKPKYPNVEELKQQFEKLYETEFKEISQIVDKNDIPKKIIKVLKDKGYKIILATNPLFPTVCTYERMKWAGLDINDFDHITTYEDYHYCKPNHKYYEEIFNKLGLNMDGSIMVGNDLSDDFSDLPKEISKILITDYLINTKNLPIDMPAYTLAEFLEYAKKEL